MPGYHIEDQKPGAKKCGHQSGKVLVAQDEQNKRLNAARLQLDIMRVPGIIVARTDAESATFLDNRSDERDQPFILGATNPELPSYRVGLPRDPEVAARPRAGRDPGPPPVRGARGRVATGRAPGSSGSGSCRSIERNARIAREAEVGTPIDGLLDAIDTRYAEVWQAEAGLKTYGEAVAEVLESPDRRGRAVRHDARGVARLRAPRVVLRGPRRRPTRSASGSPGIPSCPRPRTATTRSRAGSTTRSPSRSRRRRSPTCCGWRRRRPISRTPARFAQRDPCRVSRQDAGLQPVAVVQLGHHRAERRRDAALPRGAREARLRLQLHHLRGPPDRRPRRRGVRHGAARGRDARPRPPPAEVPAARIPVPHAAVPRRRRPAGRGPDGRFRADRGDEGDGQGFDAAPAPRPDRGADQAARGVACGMGEPLGSAGEDPRRAAAAHGGIGPARASGPGRTGRDARQRDLRQHRWIVVAGASSRSATRTRRRRSAGGG